MGEMRNFPYTPRADDIKIVREQMGRPNGPASPEDS
jgi:hypothetical protein